MAWRLLIVDDDADFASETSRFLESTGDYEVAHVTDVNEVMRFLEGQKWDLILLDVMLESPGAGFGLLRRIKANPRTRSLPVVLLSAVRREFPWEYELDEKGLPAQAFLEKPLDGEKLIGLIQSLLGPPSAKTRVE